MRNISLTVSYDGTNYHGWQCQPGVVTVEEVLRDKIQRIVDHPVKIYAGGRTDSGVHAIGQVINIFTNSNIKEEGLLRGLNSLLPSDIRVLKTNCMADDFHARYSAKSKVYLYTILNSPYNSPFYSRYVWHLPFGLDAEIMDRAIKTIVGRHDFSAFKKKGEYYKDPVREVLKAGVKKKGRFIYVMVEATGFLRYMVRNIVGTLVLIGLKKRPADFMTEVLESKDRINAGPTAPASGLVLKRISY